MPLPWPCSNEQYEAAMAAALRRAAVDGITAVAFGERGEFHTFAWDGPMPSRPVPLRPSDVIERDGFAPADFVPAAVLVVVTFIVSGERDEPLGVEATAWTDTCAE